MDVLQFGGGKDSLACLTLLKDQLEHITVLWMNTGAAFPETIELMERVRSQVPHFLEVKADVFGDIARHGWPSDVVPTSATAWGRAIRGETGIVIRPWVECCHNNIWRPMDVAARNLGAKRIYRGQRLSEHYKSPIRSGTVVDGVEYVFPLEGWSEQQVFDYLRANHVEVPAYYEQTTTSLDCWNCTAFLDAKIGQFKYMRDRHPDKLAVVQQHLLEMEHAVTKEMPNLEQAIAC
jgi:3'-phosphoadenosine 5'-phosphosulfate sulfotransferase (PAPS reductase)/FAD synthetase